MVAADAADEIIQDLIAHGAKVGTVTMELLPKAAHKGSIPCVEFLTKSVGIDPNFRGRQGMSSLTLASRSGKKDIVKLLLEFESLDLNITDDAGKKALDYAIANSKDEIVEMLQKANS